MDVVALSRRCTPHKFMGYGEPLTLTVRIEALYQSAATILIVNTHTHQMISEVREAVAVRMNWQRSRTSSTPMAASANRLSRIGAIGPSTEPQLKPSGRQGGLCRPRPVLVHRPDQAGGHDQRWTLT